MKYLKEEQRRERDHEVCEYLSNNVTLRHFGQSFPSPFHQQEYCWFCCTNSSEANLTLQADMIVIDYYSCNCVKQDVLVKERMLKREKKERE
jgi:hypothetical protein